MAPKKNLPAVVGDKSAGKGRAVATTNAATKQYLATIDAEQAKLKAARDKCSPEVQVMIDKTYAFFGRSEALFPERMLTLGAFLFTIAESKEYGDGAISSIASAVDKARRDQVRRSLAFYKWMKGDTK